MDHIAGRAHPASPGLPGILQERAAGPRRLAFRFLADGTSDEAVDWTYHDVYEHAGRIAADLLDRELTGRRVVLALDPGLHYVAALFGIFRAGATAVPSFPPTGKRAVARFASIVVDSAPDVIIADRRLEGRVAQFAAELPATVCAPEWLFVDDAYFLGTAPGREIPDAVSDPALLQYTSGSTGDPKGIVLTHENLVSNCRALEHNMGYEADRVGCTWLPPYHDMGLMGTIMLAVHGGWPLVLMSPAHFVQQPYRWLKAITDHKVTISVGPNFAFDMCTSGITDEELETLDLSTLRQVFCGSEPVSRVTLDKFRERFGPRGYDETSLIPCYGLAEATLYVSGKPTGTPLRTERLDREALENGIVRPAGDATGEPGQVAHIVSCGTVADGHDVTVVDPETLLPVPAGRVGEIWVSGPNVAQGYLGRPDLTAATFTARTAGDDGRTHLRTGDLGFLLDGELFVTGRLKDLVVIAGRNLYPQDIELTVRQAHEQVRGCAAFSVPGEGGEQLVVAAEYRGTARRLAAEGAAVLDAVIAAVTAEHGVRPAAVHFGPVGAIPMTTSGKVRRDATRKAYLQGTLRTLSPVADDTPQAVR
ncbi:fatty acyl-AMP ligase [Streptomyces sp. VNUA116]|uniref:fatty acyl-AMP ligase n=1 Tax=Streptomyces sp. VNUA116 TaxID=3062449 RepID=UPI002674E3CC|nr:fatty acyl-AMP ligase [Streptomyces sp. VNUA116]WKU47924.1 fatty acyl-AMP ligase [Streptomyces sp. VNUA116]